ncbi:MAG: hypothetical protein FWE05_03025 [Defluviitaleaceae bacterium]|nr:hypothetical protein [Defluviitaleaceae bacterium]
MGIVQSTFDWVGELYTRLFADWLHIHFLIRTVLLLLILWLIIFLAAQVFRYVLLPLGMMFYYHVIFRLWNYLFIETPQEWLYLRYHSKDKPYNVDLYAGLCDKVKKNRTILLHAKFNGMVVRTRRFANQLMMICLIAITLWVSAFGLHQEYAAPTLLIIDDSMQSQEDLYEEEADYEYGIWGIHYDEVSDVESNADEYAMYTAGIINPAEWVTGSNIILTLTEYGIQGARIRNGAGIAGNTVIEMLWEDAELVYLHVFDPDEYVSNLYWLWVRTPSGTEGYISSQLVEVLG